MELYELRLRQLDKRMLNSTKHGMAPNSQKNFKMHITTYVKFCTFYNLDMFPADILQERRYLQYLSEFHQSVDSSKSYVGGMRALHEMFGFKPPTAFNYLYQLTVNGIRRIKGHVVKQASPVTPELLPQIAERVNVNSQVQFTAWVAILSGFYLLFRKSNLVPDSSVLFDGHKQLTQQNFICMKDCYVARVYWAKNIQFHDRCLEIPMLPNPDLHLCLVFWLDHYFSAIPTRGRDPAFIVGRDTCDDNLVLSLSYAQLTHWLRKWVEQVGYEKTLFSSHSLRRGGAQWAAQCGISHHVIKLIGDWKSQAYERYLNMTLQERYDAMLIFNMSMN